MRERNQVIIGNSAAGLSAISAIRNISSSCPISVVSAENCRAFEALDVPLTKINLFFRPNNSGKSAILSALSLLSQTLDSADREVALLLNGKFEDLGTYEDIVYGNDT